ncbi:hypothetical protein Pelo_1097 [Pelomyxa schiedti]|nr:hypothetical protein Pelo_1097 [Pelomyxa schiedti]
MKKYLMELKVLLFVFRGFIETIVVLCPQKKNSSSRNVNAGGRKMNAGDRKMNAGGRKMNVGGENIQKLVFRVSRDNPLGGNRIRAAFCSNREESTKLEDTTNLMAHEVSQMAKEKTRPILNDDNENA